MKKVLSLVLIVLMLLSLSSLIISCADSTQTQTTTQAVTTTSPTAASDEETSKVYVFPDDNFNNETFTVYARTSGGSYEAQYIVSEEQTGETVEDATFARNALVEEKYKVKIALKEAKNPNETVAKEISGGEVDYDIVLERRLKMSSLATKGLLTDFSELNVDFSNSWWDQTSLRDLGINGKYYFLQNSVSIASLAGVRFFYFNKQIVEDYKLTDPYEALKNDTWTLDTFLTMCKGITTENESELGVRALVLETGSNNGVYMHMLQGCGVTYSRFDGENLVCTIGDQLEKIDGVFDQLRVVFSDKTHVVTISDALKLDTDSTATGANDYDKARSLFAQGHFLFVHGSIGISSQFKEMADDYGCMPNPKYDNNQKTYVHKCDPYTLIFAIPKADNINLSRLGKVMDYWGYESENLVIPAYYEITIKTKRVKEVTASDVIDTVRNTVRYEIIEVFSIGTVGDALYNAYNTTGLTSSWKSYSGAINKGLQSFNKTFAG